MEATARPLGLRELVLLRILVPGKTRPTPKAVLKDVAKLCDQAPGQSRVTGEIKSLRDDGLVDRKKQTLTDAGHAEALALLGLSEMPAKLPWGAIRDKYLFPRSLGLTPAATERAGLNDNKKLAPALLKRKYDLPLGAAPSPAAAMEALACKLLGYPDVVDLKSLLRAVLAKEAGADEPFTAKQMVAFAPRLLLGAKGRDGLRDAYLAGLVRLDGDVPPAAPAAGPIALAAFAVAALAAARRATSGRFGDNKVFIGHVGKELRRDPAFAGLSLGRFKELLLEAQAARLLTLSRADLPNELDQSDVKESETAYLNATFHFILLEERQ